jgi:F0F1-type ATP synthase assembly protein I
MGWLKCYRCKEDFALRDEVEDMLRRNHQSFHCPWGHSQAFIEGESEETKLRRERDRLKQQAARLHDRIREESERADKERHRANGYKGHATRISKRVKAGVCICCNRTFQNLADHMATKHPTFTPIDVDKLPRSEDKVA